MVEEQKPRWRDLAEQATREDNTERLLLLVQQLNEALATEQDAPLKHGVDAGSQRKTA